jgi:acyl-coenzyme A thioesterase PaaI-like protein
VALPEVASRLDRAVGLALQHADGGVVSLRLVPGEVAIVDDGDPVYVHGGALATCIDTAAWYAAESAAPGESDWVVSGLSLEALRLVRDEPHLVTATCRRAGRTRAVVDVEIASEAEPERPLAIGRVSLARAPTARTG